MLGKADEKSGPFPLISTSVTPGDAPGSSGRRVDAILIGMSADRAIRIAELFDETGRKQTLLVTC
jgi:hypothetical protein